MSKEQSKEDKLIALLKKKGVITLRAKFGKTQGPLNITPVIDPVTRQMRGVELLSEEEKKKTLRVVEPDTTRKISDGMTISYSNQIDQIDWLWIVFNKEIVGSLEEVHNDDLAMFYVDDFEAKVESEVSKRELKIEASNVVAKMSQTNRAELCKLFGFNPESFTPNEIKQYLYDKADTFPELLLKKSKDEKGKQRVFIADMLDKKVIVKEPTSGVYLYGTIQLGSTEDSVISWLEDKENITLVREMQSLLKS